MIQSWVAYTLPMFCCFSMQALGSISAWRHQNLPADRQSYSLRGPYLFGTRVKSYLWAPAFDHAAEEAAAAGGGLPSIALTGTLARHPHKLTHYEQVILTLHCTGIFILPPKLHLPLLPFFDLWLFWLWSDCLTNLNTVSQIVSILLTEASQFCCYVQRYRLKFSKT